MKKNLMFFALIGCFVLSIGCTSSPRPVRQRGWIGGGYLEANPSFFKTVTSNYFQHGEGVIPALPESVKEKQKGAVFVSNVYDKTPVAQADIREGDLILAVDDIPVPTIKALRKIIDQRTPGTEVRLTVLRQGETLVKPVLIGKESYWNIHTLSLGFHLSSEIDPIPHPDFNLLGLLSFSKNKRRLELNSPEYQYYQTVQPMAEDDTVTEEQTLANWEGWDAWCLIIGLGGKKIILDQTL